MHEADRTAAIWPISLAQIDNVVSAHLGPGRVTGNAHGPCFSRQVSMYLAKHVGGWSLPKIGHFYNGRHHTTVLHAIRRIEGLRKSDEAVDALIDVLTAALSPGPGEGASCRGSAFRSAFVDAVASRVIDRLGELRFAGPDLAAHPRTSLLELSRPSSSPETCE